MKISNISVGNIGEISDIGDNRSEISHGNSFEGKIAEKSEISPIFRRYIGIGPKFWQVEHKLAWVIFCFKILKIYRKYR